MSKFATLLIVAVVPLSLAASATTTPLRNPITRIEEDWELVIDTTESDFCGPQMTTTMSPVGDTAELSMSFNMNYRSDPFRKGGVQLIAWDGESSVVVESAETGALRTEGEVITWSQRMSLSGGQLQYEVFDGVSTTWGKFGVGGVLQISMASDLDSLDAYTPAETVKNSGSGWQSNRVGSMKLLRVRYYSNGQLDHVDETVRTVIGAD